MGVETRPEGSRARILTVVPHYLPGYRAGGPIRSVSALIDRLSDEFDFRVVTGDRDVGAESPYPDIDSNRWTGVGEAEVRYLPPARQSMAGLADILNEIPSDLLYLNAFFHPVFSLRVLALRRVGRIQGDPLLLAPRGHLSPGALAVKPWRKKVYVALVKALGLCDGVVFHASTAMEREEVRRVFPNARVEVAPNLLPLPAISGNGSPTPNPGETPPKERGRLRAVFLSRIAPKKNLLAALEACRGLESELVTFSIVGPVDDEAYWQRCQQLIDDLPPNVTIEVHGGVCPDRVPRVLADHHLFVLPTRSENFGHAILEALSAGVPALISDQTPWTDLEDHGAGWCCPDDDVACFARRLREAASLDRGEHRRMSEAATRYAEQAVSQEEAEQENREMLRGLAGDGIR